MRPIVIIFGVLSVVVIGAIVIVATQSDDPKPTQTTNTTSTTAAPQTPDITSPLPDAPSDGQSGKYVDYSPDIAQSELKAGNKVVLYFYATWCPFCKAADQAFRNKIKDIPVGVVVLKVNYDKSDDLKQKYNITYQHTFVQIDSNLNQVTKWSGGDVDALKQNIK